jgi:hypothetical protein
MDTQPLLLTGEPHDWATHQEASEPSHDDAPTADADDETTADFSEDEGQHDANENYSHGEGANETDIYYRVRRILTYTEEMPSFIAGTYTKHVKRLSGIASEVVDLSVISLYSAPVKENGMKKKVLPVEGLKSYNAFVTMVAMLFVSIYSCVLLFCNCRIEFTLMLSVVVYGTFLLIVYSLYAYLFAKGVIGFGLSSGVAWLSFKNFTLNPWVLGNLGGQIFSCAVSFLGPYIFQCLEDWFPTYVQPFMDFVRQFFVGGCLFSLRAVSVLWFNVFEHYIVEAIYKFIHRMFHGREDDEVQNNQQQNRGGGRGRRRRRRDDANENQQKKQKKQKTISKLIRSLTFTDAYSDDEKFCAREIERIVRYIILYFFWENFGPDYVKTDEHMLGLSLLSYIGSLIVDVSVYGLHPCIFFVSLMDITFTLACITNLQCIMLLQTMKN